MEEIAGKVRAHYGLGISAEAEDGPIITEE